MLTSRLRSQIEWHFNNFTADIALYNERVREIAESGMGVNYDRVGRRSNAVSKPTERKAIMLEALEQEKNWENVVRNTFIAFQFEPEYKLMEELYINGRKYQELFAEGVSERTFWRWRDKWLEYAYKCAKKFRLL